MHRDPTTLQPCIQFHELLATLLKDAHGEITEEIEEEQQQRQRHRNSIARSSMTYTQRKRNSMKAAPTRRRTEQTRRIATWASVLPPIESRVGQQLSRQLMERGVLAAQTTEEEDVATMAASAMIASKVGLKLLTRVRANRLESGTSHADQAGITTEAEQRNHALRQVETKPSSTQEQSTWGLPGFGTRPAPRSTIMF